MSDTASEHARSCSFCSRPQSEVGQLIAGPESVSICDACVELCREILAEKGPSVSVSPSSVVKIPPPKEICDQLDEYVIGQEQAKRVLSVAVYNHYKRVFAGALVDDVELQKTNILLIGPTGCGKTLLAETLARILDVPFTIADATSLTEAGYVGEDVENILLRLIQAADYDLARAEKGIVYIDEIDKTARKAGDNPSITRDVSGEGVQQALLKIIEGTVANVPPQGGRKHPHQDFIQLDTTDVLFICGGAFEGLDTVVAERAGRRQAIGFRDKESQGKADLTSAELLRMVIADDLLKYGLIPEFVGRLPMVVSVDPLDKETMVRILKEPKNAIAKQFRKLLALDHVELVFTDDALEAAAEKALEYKTGARGLRTIIEQVLLDAMFEIPSLRNVRRCRITREVITGEAEPELTHWSETA